MAESAIPSRFIGELPQEHVEIVAEPGLQPRADRLGRGIDWSVGAETPRGGAFGSRNFAEAATSPRRARPLHPGQLRAGARRRDKRVGGFSPGDPVFHQKFGYGTVQAVEDNKLAIAFEKAGDKKVMDSFVEKV